MLNSRIRLASLAGLALASLLSTGVQNKMARHPGERSYAPAKPIRSFRFTKGGTRKTVFPGQTPVQAKAAQAAAKEKRARRALTAASNAKRSAEGYHPIARIAAMGKLAHPAGHTA